MGVNMHRYPPLCGMAAPLRPLPLPCALPEIKRVLIDSKLFCQTQARQLGLQLWGKQAVMHRGTGSTLPNMMHTIDQFSCCSHVSLNRVWQVWMTTAGDGPGLYATARQLPIRSGTRKAGRCADLYLARLGVKLRKGVAFFLL